jgi:hypothetical protein
MTSDLVSRVYQPDPEKCCERCAFGRGPHAGFCPASNDAAFEDADARLGRIATTLRAHSDVLTKLAEQRRLEESLAHQQVLIERQRVLIERLKSLCPSEKLETDQGS